MVRARRSHFVLPVLAAVIALCGCGSSGGTSGTTDASGRSGASSGSGAGQTTTAAAAPSGERKGTVAVALSEWKVGVPSAKATAGEVTFEARNTGKVPHELVVLRTSKSADGLGTGNVVPEPGKLGGSGIIGPGAEKSVSVKLDPGHYVLICNLPSHYKLGMHADFTVR